MSRYGVRPSVCLSVCLSVSLSRCNSGGAALTQSGRKQQDCGSMGPQHGAQQQMRAVLTNTNLLFVK